jgi:hypothetical protein
MLQSEKENRDIWFYKINCKLQLFLLRCWSPMEVVLTIDNDN